MKHSVLAGGCAVALALLAGCSSQDAETSDSTETAGTAGTTSAPADTAPGAAPAEGGPADGDRVTFGSSDIGEISSITCQTDAGVTTITIAAAQDTSVVVTDEETPAVKSVSIGEPGSDGPSLIFLEGVSPDPEATRDGNRYTVKGTGMGTESADDADPAQPVEMPFELTVTCP
ncbi:lipoprotein LpqH [[Mycobacterium] wendilense]|uniref:Lipoprotein LpqH n=1 Tax=[Mycobacterium] wendilense TaxID=3064284 RepID=A0ABN9NXC9_9MYCO|nr:lipoprotein LpqH [Mycolicibacterium sp. MU0050]CAJ1578803.1 lipoprotein LpqH [Mycolicibacterium sp. MU0050]